MMIEFILWEYIHNRNAVKLLRFVCTIAQNGPFVLPEN